MFPFKSCTRPTKKIQWERHCIFSSSQGRSCEFGGLILFKDGSISSGHGGFRRREAIPDAPIGRLILQRSKESDILKLTNTKLEVAWLEYEYDIYPKWHQIVPIGTPAPGDGPIPLRQRSALAVTLEKTWIACVFGFGGQPLPPNFS